MPGGDADKQAEKPEPLPRVGGGTAEGKQAAHQTGAACHEPVGAQGWATMEAGVRRENMLAAYRRVGSNTGAAGVDGMTVDELQPSVPKRWEAIREEWLKGTYAPTACAWGGASQDRW